MKDLSLQMPIFRNNNILLETKYMEQLQHTYANGDVYEGQWDNDTDEPSGQGIMRYANGGVYEGQWNNGEWHGQGIMTYAIGNVYEGQWNNGQWHGQGKMTSMNGTVYEGIWNNDNDNDNDEPYGQGTITYANRDVYEGQWDDNCAMTGEGRMTYANTDVYEGQWDDDEPSGQGIMRYANGNVYEGQWHNGRWHGQGTLTSANGDVNNGPWNNGQVVDGLPPVRPIERGLAFEIHDAADKINKNKYYELLQIDLPKEHYASIDMIDYIKGQFRTIIEEKMPDETGTLSAILLKANVLINANKVLVGRTIDFVMKQPDNFKELYLSSFILDCARAYDGGENTMSCAKGILERIIMSLISPLTAIIDECDNAESATQEEAARCLNYKNLFRLLTQTINIQDIIKDWANKPDIQDMSAKERKEDLISFITSKYVDLGMTPPTQMIQAKADELDYVFKDLVWGGRKHVTKRRTRKHGTKRRTRKHGTKRRTRKYRTKRRTRKHVTKRRTRKHVTKRRTRKYRTKRNLKKN